MINVNFIMHLCIIVPIPVRPEAVPVRPLLTLACGCGCAAITTCLWAVVITTSLELVNAKVNAAVPSFLSTYLLALFRNPELFSERLTRTTVATVEVSTPKGKYASLLTQRDSRAR